MSEYVELFDPRSVSQNGSYEKDSTNLTLSSDDYKGNTGSWFKGSVEKEIKFNLKRKDKE